MAVGGVEEEVVVVMAVAVVEKWEAGSGNKSQLFLLMVAVDLLTFENLTIFGFPWVFESKCF